MEQWRGKVALITGASAGIGAELAKTLVVAGLKVVGLARRKEKIEKLIEELQAHGKLYAVQADIRKEDEVLEAFQWIKTNVGPIHILINSAGIIRISDMCNGSTNAWKEILETNVLGLSITTREAIKDMMSNSIDGHIVHISSILGHIVPNLPNMGIYPASKHAIRAITQRQRHELRNLGSKIKISVVSPSLTDTGMLETSAAVSEIPGSIEFVKEYIKSTPHLYTDDVVKAVCFVLGTPPHVQVHDLIINPVGEAF